MHCVPPFPPQLHYVKFPVFPNFSHSSVGRGVEMLEKFQKLFMNTICSDLDLVVAYIFLCILETIHSVNVLKNQEKVGNTEKLQFLFQFHCDQKRQTEIHHILKGEHLYIYIKRRVRKSMCPSVTPTACALKFLFINTKCRGGGMASTN